MISGILERMLEMPPVPKPEEVNNVSPEDLEKLNTIIRVIIRVEKKTSLSINFCISEKNKREALLDTLSSLNNTGKFPKQMDTLDITDLKDYYPQDNSLAREWEVATQLEFLLKQKKEKGVSIINVFGGDNFFLIDGTEEGGYRNHLFNARREPMHDALSGMLIIFWMENEDVVNSIYRNNIDAVNWGISSFNF